MSAAHALLVLFVRIFARVIVRSRWPRVYGGF
jgi:hypothetical protein